MSDEVKRHSAHEGLGRHTNLVGRRWNPCPQTSSDRLFQSLCIAAVPSKAASSARTGHGRWITGVPLAPLSSVWVGGASSGRDK